MIKNFSEWNKINESKVQGPLIFNLDLQKLLPDVVGPNTRDWESGESFKLIDTLEVYETSVTDDKVTKLENYIIHPSFKNRPVKVYIKYTTQEVGSYAGNDNSFNILAGLNQKSEKEVLSLFMEMFEGDYLSW